MVSNDAFRYEFTGRELMYFLFKKKVCPRCGDKLSKVKDSEIVEGYLLNSTQEAFFVPNAKVKRYRYLFSCHNCKTVYPINELVK